MVVPKNCCTFALENNNKNMEHNLTKKQLKEKVSIICYRKKYKMTREEAIKEYREGMMYCDGSERDRYTNIYCQLISGFKTCSDEL